MLLRLLAYLAAVAVATALGSIIQTQFNMLALQQLGVPIHAGTWLLTTARDLVGFTPVYGVVIAASLLFAFLVAAIPARWLTAYRPLLFAVAGGCGVYTAIVLANSLMPMTPIAATRFISGTAALTLAGAIGGWVYAVMAPTHPG